MTIQTDPYIRCDPPNVAELVISLAGAASTGTNKAAWYCQHSYTIARVSVYSTDAPTGTSLIVDCNKNGTTVFTDPSKRPEVAIGENSDDSDTPDVAMLSAGDRVTIDVDQVGSGTPGGNPLMITVVLVKAG